jgi:hypothetical protein
MAATTNKTPASAASRAKAPAVRKAAAAKKASAAPKAAAKTKLHGSGPAGNVAEIASMLLRRNAKRAADPELAAARRKAVARSARVSQAIKEIDANLVKIRAGNDQLERQLAKIAELLA